MKYRCYQAMLYLCLSALLLAPAFAIAAPGLNSGDPAGTSPPQFVVRDPFSGKIVWPCISAGNGSVHIANPNTGFEGSGPADIIEPDDCECGSHIESVVCDEDGGNCHSVSIYDEDGDGLSHGDPVVIGTASGTTWGLASFKRPGQG